MREIEDLKNHILAMQQKIDNTTLLIHKIIQKEDKSSEILNIIHNMNFERSRQNNVAFETCFPDIIRRLAELEEYVRNIKRKEIDDSISIRDMKIDDVDFKYTRTVRTLKNNNIENVRQLLEYSELDLLKTPNIGRVSVADIRESLYKHGLTLKLNDY